MRDADSIRKSLNSDYAGSQNVKDALASKLAAWMSGLVQPKNIGAFTVVARGEGGTGKILLAKAIAKAVFGDERGCYEHVIAYSCDKKSGSKSLPWLFENHTGLHPVTTGGFIKSNSSSGALLNLRTTAHVFDCYAGLIEEIRFSPKTAKFILYVGFRPDDNESADLTNLIREADVYVELTNDLNRLILVVNQEIDKYNGHPLISSINVDPSATQYFAKLFLDEHRLLYNMRPIGDAINKAAAELQKETPTSGKLPPFRLILRNDTVTYERITTHPHSGGI